MWLILSAVDNTGRPLSKLHIMKTVIRQIMALKTYARYVGVKISSERVDLILVLIRYDSVNDYLIPTNYLELAKQKGKKPVKGSNYFNWRQTHRQNLLNHALPRSHKLCNHVKAAW